MANTLSVTTAPPISSAMPMPITVTIGTAAFFSACTNRMLRCAEALGARGADVVLLQHLEHGRARDARDQRDIDAAERDRRQDQVLEPGPEALRDRRIALHRQPIELRARRHRPADSRPRRPAREKPNTAKTMMRRSIQVPAFQAATTPIGTATAIARISVTTISDSVGSMRCAISSVTGRLVKIEVPRSPCRMRQTQLAELDQEGPVEPEALADALDVGGRRLIAGDHRGRIARRDVEQAEHEQRDHRHDGDGREDASDDVAETWRCYGAVMRSSPRPRRTATGPSRCRRRSCARPDRSGRSRSAHRRRVERRLVQALRIAAFSSSSVLASNQAAISFSTSGRSASRTRHCRHWRGSRCRRPG